MLSGKNNPIIIDTDYYYPASLRLSVMVRRLSTSSFACLFFLLSGTLTPRVVGASSASPTAPNDRPGLGNNRTTAERGVRVVGYFDAQRQSLLQPHEVPFDALTHLVVTNLVRVDNEGYLIPVGLGGGAEEASFDASLQEQQAWANVESLLSELRTKLEELQERAGRTQLVLSLRGHPDDVALDEVAEVDAARKALARRAAQATRDFALDGLEVEWHSDDVAGGKPRNTPFDDEERGHYGNLVQELSMALRPEAKTLSVAVRPRKEELSPDRVRDFVDWLAVRAYGMRGLTDPHPSSLRDAVESLQEWTARGVEPQSLVLTTPLFAKPGAALRLRKDHESHHRSWRELHDQPTYSPSGGGGRQGRNSSHQPVARGGGGAEERPEDSGDDGSSTEEKGSAEGDLFLDNEGRVWWMSGIATTRAKANYVGEGNFGGLAFRDLHHDNSRGGSMATQSPRREAPERQAPPTPGSSTTLGSPSRGQQAGGTSLLRVGAEALETARARVDQMVPVVPEIVSDSRRLSAASSATAPSRRGSVPLLQRAGSRGLSLLQQGLKMERSEKTQSPDL